MCILLFMSNLISHVTSAYPSVAVLNVSNDVVASQFTQHFLFSHVYSWEQQYHSKFIWNFFATSHGKGAVDGIGGSVKCSVWRHVSAGCNAPLNAQKYADIAKECNPNVLMIYVSSEEIQSKALEVQN